MRRLLSVLLVGIVSSLIVGGVVLVVCAYKVFPYPLTYREYMQGYSGSSPGIGFWDPTTRYAYGQLVELNSGESARIKIRITDLHADYWEIDVYVRDSSGQLFTEKEFNSRSSSTGSWLVTSFNAPQYGYYCLGSRLTLEPSTTFQNYATVEFIVEIPTRSGKPNESFLYFGIATIAAGVIISISSVIVLLMKRRGARQ